MQPAIPFQVIRTALFERWFENLCDRRAQAIIEGRLVRLEQGLRGDVRSVGGGVSELRIDYGPGYRLYFVERGGRLIILLCGGDKSSQKQDIPTAHALAGEAL